MVVVAPPAHVQDTAWGLHAFLALVVWKANRAAAGSLGLDAFRQRRLTLAALAALALALLLAPA